MFIILHGTKVIGTSKLKAGDPPMGVAFGEFYPSEDFSTFMDNQPYENDEPNSRRWNNLSLQLQNGENIDCTDVTLLEVDFGNEFEWEVTALGIQSQQYQKLFPKHFQAYNDQFK